MIFRPELAAKVAAGTKCETRRPTKGKPCRYAVGQTYAVQPGRGEHGIARVFVTSVELETLGMVFEHDARREGFATRAEFYDYWGRLYPGPIDQMAEVYVIRFHLVEDATSRADDRG